MGGGWSLFKMNRPEIVQTLNNNNKKWGGGGGGGEEDHFDPHFLDC